MSLVNLAHVCSHLQNASLARLGLTSIPYSRLHLSLALLLHKQGFLSSLKLAGSSPPASAFPATSPDTHRISSAPIRDRSPKSGEAALYDMVFDGKREEDLRKEGFGEEALDFAREHRELTKEQLEKDGWDVKAVDFLLACSGRSSAELEAEGLDAQALSILQQNPIEPAFLELRADLARQGLTEAQLRPIQIERRLRSILRKRGFSKQTLQYFAGTSRFTTPLHLRRDGITLSAMGLSIPSQPISLLPSQYRDPEDLETEGVVTQANRSTRRLWLGLKYWDGMPVLSKARMISKPTKRIWLTNFELGKVVRGSSAGEVKGMRQVGEVVAVSTDKGVLEARECVERRLGGMVLCRVW